MANAHQKTEPLVNHIHALTREMEMKATDIGVDKKDFFGGASLLFGAAAIGGGGRRNRKIKRLNEIRRRSAKVWAEIIRLERDLSDRLEHRAVILQEKSKWLAKSRELTQRANALSDDDLVRTKIEISLNLIGLVVSGGTANAAIKALGSAIGTVGSAIGFASNEEKIRRLLRGAQNALEKFKYQSELLDAWDHDQKRLWNRKAELEAEIDKLEREDARLRGINR